jgi:hypothetical protein
MDSATAEKIMREIVAKFPDRCVSSGLADGEEAQRALDAWIKAGAVPGDEHLYGLSVEEDEDTDGK